MSPLSRNRLFDSASRPLASQRISAGVIALVCFASATYLLLNQRDQDHVRAANELGLQQRYAQAATEARKVTRSPAAGRALLIRAYSAQARGRHGQAARLFRRAAERDPRSWHVHRDWAISLLALGRRDQARRQIDLASTLNPRMEAPPGF